MKKLLFVGIAVTALHVAPASAADAMIKWTGFYAGVLGGYGWNALSTNQFVLLDDDEPDVIIPFSGPAKADPKGAFFGARIGASYEFQNHIVVGVAADISRGSLKGKGSIPTIQGLTTGPIPIEGRAGRLWTVSGKLGYAFDTFMIYATGGFASAKSEVTLLAEGGISAGDVTHKGWVAGVGAEFRLIGDWRLATEYRYLSLGTEDHCFERTSFCSPVKWRGQQGLVSLNYQF
jgi:outer membrane immunogenic protein